MSICKSCDMYEREISDLTAENERLKREVEQLKCNFAPILHFAKQEQEKKGEPATVNEPDGCPLEGAVLRREWKQLKADLAAARKELDEARGIIIELVKWHGGIHMEYCPEDDTCDCQGKPINDRIDKFLKGC